MKLKVELTYWNGIVDDDNPVFPDPEYSLIDCDTGTVLSEAEFSTCEALEAAIAARYPGCVRWVPPPAPPDEAVAIERVLDLLDAGTALDPAVVRRLMISQTYQYSHTPDIAARIAQALTGFLRVRD